MISQLLQVAGDPDWEIFSTLYSEGVHLGVDKVLPRKPEVFEEKTRWRLSDPLEEATLANGNYQSIELHKDYVTGFFREEATDGLMLEMSEDEARKEWGNNLCLASLAAIEEKGGRLGSSMTALMGSRSTTVSASKTTSGYPVPVK